MKKPKVVHLGRDIGKTWCGAPMKKGFTEWKPGPNVCRACLKSWNAQRRSYGLQEYVKV